MAEAAAAAREALIEMVAEADESLMEKFFEAGTLTQDQLVAGLRSATASAKLFPLLCTSSSLNIGVQPLLDAIVDYVPSPAERAVHAVDPKSGEAIERPFSENGTTAAFVWKTIADPFAGRITLFRVMTGVLKTDSTVYNKTRGHLGTARPRRAASGKNPDQRCPNCARATLALSPSSKTR